MGIKSIKIKNLLSFDELIINDFKDINCIVGKNNSGKSNLLKLIRFFYNKLEGKRELPPTLNSKYSAFGTITIIYDTSRIKQIVTSDTNKGKSSFFKHIYNTLFKEEKEKNIFSLIGVDSLDKESTYELTLKINSNDSTQWSTKNKDIINIINYLYPFFDIETRHIDLYDWNKLWIIVSRLKSFNINKLKQDEIVDFFNDKLSSDGDGYKEYIGKIQNATQTNKYNYREKVLNYVKAGLKGQTFLIDEQSLEMQSDGTNSHRFIKIALELLISLTRRDYINPTIYIDEPEVGLHPKRNEELIYKLYDIYNSYKKSKKKKKKEKGKYKTPYPNIIFATHSPNIVKEVIKLFEVNQQILHFSKNNKDNTIVQKMKSTYKDNRFLNIFSDNESRLFFSNFILFVEGETELEIFGNKKLLEKFPILKDIDVYKSSSNVLGSYVNPAYSNTAIPYLYLFDADKIYSFKRDSANPKIKKLTFENKNKNLYRLPDGKAENEEKIEDLIKKYKKGFNKKHKDKFEVLQKLKTLHSKEFNFNKLSFRIEKVEEYKESIGIIENYLDDYNVKFLHTTIEEILINDTAKDIFFKSIEQDIKIDNFLYDMRTVEYTVSFYKQRVDIGKIKLLSPRKRIRKKIVYKHHKYSKEIELYLIDYLRVVYFNGKFEILTNKISDINYDNSEFTKKQINEFDKLKISLLKKLKSYNLKTVKQKEAINKILESYISTRKYSDDTLQEIVQAINKFPLNKQAKTSGWATSFLNFAIDEIEDSLTQTNVDEREKEFRTIFKQNFGELYDIITTIETKI